MNKLLLFCNTLFRTKRHCNI